MESTKRQLSIKEEPESSKKLKLLESHKPKLAVVLNPADSDLDFNVEGNGLRGSALHEQGFAYCWSGARASVGITRGKYCFSCKIISAQPVDMEDTPFEQRHVCRLGISRGDNEVGKLGETDHSFGFGGTGKFSNAGKFADYGEKFGVGDIVVCAVNLENKPLATIGFSVNGKWFGSKYFNAGPIGFGVVDTPPRKLQWESAIFPHVMLKNVVVELQFSIEDGLVPEEGYKPWACALEDGNAILGPAFTNLRDCEVIMMVGLPASGKTTWAEKWVKEHPEKRYVLLGTNLALDQMKVPGLLRKHNYGERFDRLMDRATGIFNTLLSRASRTPRNFIIDQTNVYKGARKRKMKPFSSYQKIAIVVFSTPEELKNRAQKRFKEMGKEVPNEAVNEMLANYVLPMSKDMPGTDEYFDQVIFPELNRAESQRYLDEMKRNLPSKLDNSPFSRGSSIQSYNSNFVQKSRESSIQSYNSPSLQYQQSVSATGGHWHGSYARQPLLSSPYGHQSSPKPACFPMRDDFNHYRSYVGYDQSRRTDIEGPISTPGGVIDPYRNNRGAGDSYTRPDTNSSNFVPRIPTDPYHGGMDDPYARRTTPFAYNTHGGFSSVPGDPQTELPAQRQPMFLPGTSTTYGSPYGTPNPSLAYGTPNPSLAYGTPNPNPAYGNSPLQCHSGGYVPPRPAYY